MELPGKAGLTGSVHSLCKSMLQDCIGWEYNQVYCSPGRRMISVGREGAMDIL
jgi:hypothetical protein